MKTNNKNFSTNKELKKIIFEAAKRSNEYLEGMIAGIKVGEVLQKDRDEHAKMMDELFSVDTEDRLVPTLNDTLTEEIDEEPELDRDEKNDDRVEQAFEHQLTKWE